jgi:hypothetical protein
MDELRASQGERLKQLSLNKAETTAQLKKKLHLAESVLKLAELCRKFETEQEKVRSIYLQHVLKLAELCRKFETEQEKVRSIYLYMC